MTADERWLGEVEGVGPDVGRMLAGDADYVVKFPLETEPHQRQIKAPSVAGKMRNSR